MTVLCVMIAEVENLECPLLPADPTIPLSEAQLYAVLDRAGWPQELWEQAAAVAYCESNWIPAAHDGINKGLFQVVFFLPHAWENEFFTGWYDYAVSEYDYWPQWDDPIDNARVAYWIYDRNNGWTHNWPNCGPED